MQAGGEAYDDDEERRETAKSQWEPRGNEKIPSRSSQEDGPRGGPGGPGVQCHQQ